MSRSGTAHSRDEGGFSVVELLVAMTLLLVLAAAFAGTITSAIAAQALARERTLAEQAALGQIEAIRALPYDSVGVVEGNPPGSVVASRTVSVGDRQATLSTAISYVDDPTPTGYPAGTDYKRVVVTVRRAGDAKLLTREATYVAPSVSDPYGGIEQAKVAVRVVDMAASTPLPGATVTLGTGPSATRTDHTDAAGNVTFPGLQANPSSGPQSFYDLTATLAGYTTLPDDLPPSTAAHVQLAPGQTFSTVLRMYRPATIDVTLDGPDGTPYTDEATVVVGSPRQAQAFAVDDGSLTVSQLNGEPLVPGLAYTVAAWSSDGRFAPAATATVPPDYPTDLSSSFALQLGSTAYETAALTVTVTGTGGAPVEGARVDLSGGPASTFASGSSDGTGTVVFDVPAGSGYTVRASGPGAADGTWSGAVGDDTTVTVHES